MSVLACLLARERSFTLLLDARSGRTALPPRQGASACSGFGCREWGEKKERHEGQGRKPDAKKRAR